MQSIDYFVKARSSLAPTKRLERIKKNANHFRDDFTQMPKIQYFHSVPLIRVPYPTRFGFSNIAKGLVPYLHILNRLFVVQFKQQGCFKIMLISPSDIEGNKQTPFFKRLSQSFGIASKLVEPIMAPVMSSTIEALNHLGIRPEQVDYISYDHLHTQDLRKWLGSNQRPGLFANAKLIVTPQEWHSANNLLPFPSQQDWYCPNGLKDIDEEKILFLEQDSILGDGLALIHTPGHTEGNHSFVIHTQSGVVVISENGIGPDAYAPMHSKIRSIKFHAEKYGQEVILNSNTLERSVDQYLSMVLEKHIAGPNTTNPNFYNIFNSSQFTSYWAFPGLSPSFELQDFTSGKLVEP